MIPQGQLRENGGFGRLILPRAFETAHFLVQALRVLEQMDQIEPDLPHPLGCRAHLTIKCLVFPEQITGKFLQFLPCGSGAAAELAEQGRVRHGSPSDHSGVQSGKPSLHGPHFLNSPQIAVVAHRIFAGCQRLGKFLQMHRAAVLFVPHPGMDDQAGDRIPVIDLQQPPKFLRIGEAQPGLHGNRQADPGEHLVKEPLQFLRSCQKSRALALGRYGTGGTPQVQVHLGISHIRHLFGRPEEVRRAAGHHLRYGGQTAVTRRVHLPPVAIRHDMMAGRGEKGDKISVRTAEMSGPYPAEHHLGDTVQRRKIVTSDHFSFSSHSA